MTTEQEINKSLEETKALIFQTFFNQFQSISNFVRGLRINPAIKNIILTKFDEAFLWTKEGFSTLELVHPEQTAKIVELNKENIITESADQQAADAY